MHDIKVDRNRRILCHEIKSHICHTYSLFYFILLISPLAYSSFSLHSSPFGNIKEELKIFQPEYEAVVTVPGTFSKDASV